MQLKAEIEQESRGAGETLYQSGGDFYDRLYKEKCHLWASFCSAGYENPPKNDLDR